MTEIQKPEELAFAATQMISDAADKIVKRRLAMVFASAVIGVGIIVATPATTIPFAVFGGAYGLWDMYRQRKANLTLLEAFNHVSEGLGEHDSVQLMDPLKRAFEKVVPLNKNDLNVVGHYRRNKNNTLLMGTIAVINPLFMPMMLSVLISIDDQKNLKAIKESIPDVQKNLRIKYPLTFDKIP